MYQLITCQNIRKQCFEYGKKISIGPCGYLLVRVEDRRADLCVLPRRPGELTEQVVVPGKYVLVMIHGTG